MLSPRSSIALAALLAASCTLRFDTRDARRSGPSMPEVHVEPEAPGTLDDLTVVIDTPSIADRPGEITYAYAWRRADELVATTPTLAAEHTREGEAWTLSVTPSLDGIPGEPATKHVTIGNTPPSLRYVGLFTHDPFVDDVVEAYFGPSSDPDGESVTRHVEWLLDGQVVATGVTQLALATIGAARPGATLVVRATPTDGEAVGETVTAGPMTIRPAGSQWRPLVPSRSGTFAFSTGAVYDPVRRRFLFVEQGREHFEIWELPIDHRRWVRLTPADADTHASFFAYSAPLFDVARQRIVFFNIHDEAWQNDGVPRNEIKVVDVGEPGREAWHTITLAEDETPAIYRFYESAFFDVPRDRIVFYGGVCIPAGESIQACDDLWAIHLTPGEERWEQLDDAVGIGGPSGGTWITDERRSRAYLIGGTRPVSPMEPIPAQATRDVRALDLTTDTFSPVVVAQAPSNVTFAGGATVAGTSTALVFHGVETFSSTELRREVWRFDLDSLAFSLVTPTGDAALFSPSRFPVAGFDPDSGRVLIARGGPYEQDGVLFDPDIAFFAMSPDGNVTAIDVPGVHSPRGVVGAIVVPDEQGGMLIMYGLGATADGRVRVEPGAFTIDKSGIMRPRATTVGASPRFFAATGASAPGVADFRNSDVIVFGGSTRTGELEMPLTDVWRVSEHTSTVPWTLLGTFSGVDATGARAYESAPGRGLLLGAPGVDDVSRFECLSGTCSLTTLGNVPGARSTTYIQVGSSPGLLIGNGAGSAYAPSSGPGDTPEAVVVEGLPSLRGVSAFPLVRAMDATRAIVAGATWIDGGVTYAAGILDMHEPPRFTNLPIVDGRVPAPLDTRFYAAVAWDQQRRRLLMYGGQPTPTYRDPNGGPPFSDLWELRYEEAPPTE